MKLIYNMYELPVLKYDVIDTEQPINIPILQKRYNIYDNTYFIQLYFHWCEDLVDVEIINSLEGCILYKYKKL